MDPFEPASMRIGLPPAEVLDEAELAGRVAGDDVLVAVAVPIEADRRGQGAELDLVGLLLKEPRRPERRHVLDHSAGILQQGDPAVLLADHQIHVAVAVPIHGRRHDHAEGHGERLAVAGKVATGRVPWLGPRADVLKPRESVDELAADDVQVAVAVEVSQAGRGHAVDVDRLTARLNLDRLPILRLVGGALVWQQVHVAVQRAAGPLALRVEGVVPAVVGPVADAYHEVQRAVAVVVGVLPLVGADLAAGLVDVRPHGQLHPLDRAAPRHADVFVAGHEHAGPAASVRDLHVAQAAADQHARKEKGVRNLLCEAPSGPFRQKIPGTFSLEEVRPVVGHVGAGDEEVQVAVAVVVHGQRPSPEPHAQVDCQARVVVHQTVEPAVAELAVGQLGGVRQSADFRRPERPVVHPHVVGNVGPRKVGSSGWQHQDQSHARDNRQL